MNSNAWVPTDSVERYVKRMLSESSVLHERYNDLLDLVIVRARLRAGQRVLDIGSGGGVLAGRIAERRNCEVIGLDPSEAMVAYARKQPAPPRGSVSYAVNTRPFLNLPFDDASFDAVVSTYSFHHVEPEDKANAIARMKRVLKPGGRLCIGDICFRDDLDKQQAFERWSEELEEEYFAYLPVLEEQFGAVGMDFHVDAVGPISYVVSGRKQP